MFRIICFAVLFFAVEESAAQHSKNYDSGRGAQKATLHEHYRKIVSGGYVGKQEKRTVKSLLGAWESVTDTTLPARSYAKQRVEHIQKHGLLFTKKEALLHNYYSDSMHRTRWLWGVKDDTIVYFLPNRIHGDTNVIVEQIVSVQEKGVIFKNISRDTISTALPCYSGPRMMAAMYMNKPVYNGDMQRYLEEGLKDFNAKDERYEVLIKFLVTCEGEIGYAYPFAAEWDEFEARVIALLKNSSKWTPAGYNGETYDYYHYINVEWNKGFVDFEYPKMNY